MPLALTTVVATAPLALVQSPVNAGMLDAAIWPVSATTGVVEPLVTEIGEVPETFVTVPDPLPLDEPPEPPPAFVAVTCFVHAPPPAVTFQSPFCVASVWPVSSTTIPPVSDTPSIVVTVPFVAVLDVAHASAASILFCPTDDVTIEFWTALAGRTPAFPRLIALATAVCCCAVAWLPAGAWRIREIGEFGSMPTPVEGY